MFALYYLPLLALAALARTFDAILRIGARDLADRMRLAWRDHSPLPSLRLSAVESLIQSRITFAPVANLGVGSTHIGAAPFASG